MKKLFVVACIPAYDEEGSIGGVVVRALRFVDRVVICDDGSRVPRGCYLQWLVGLLCRAAHVSRCVEGSFMKCRVKLS